MAHEKGNKKEAFRGSKQTKMSREEREMFENKIINLIDIHFFLRSIFVGFSGNELRMRKLSELN